MELQILPNDTVWLLNLVERIVEVATGESKSILVDSKLIDGPNANQRGKLWIPLALLAQFFFIIWPIHKSIKRDLEEEKQQRPHWEVRAEEFGHSAGIFEDDRADEQAITEALQQDDIRLDQLNDFDDEDDDLFD
jgi:hypothetical protein